MKYCEKCGKEIMDESVVCPGCGCAVATSGNAGDTKPENKPQTQGFLIGGLCVLAVGIILFLFINMWVGAISVLVAELIFGLARTKIKTFIKSNNPSIEKKELKTAMKEFESANGTAKACKIMMIVSLCILLVCLLFI